MITLPIDGNTVDLDNAPRYRKKVTVLAFKVEHGATYDKRKSWGSPQFFEGPHYVIVGAVERPSIIEWEEPGGRASRAPAGGIVISTTDVYGCANDEFVQMYEPTGDVPHEYRKKESVRALKMNAPFFVQSKTGDGNAESMVSAPVGDYLVLQPGGERQHISAGKFEDIYERVSGSVSAAAVLSALGSA